MNYRQAAVWQKAMVVAREVYRLVPLLPDEERYGMRSQITRAGVSIAANVAEGWARETPRDKAHFFAIAQGSLAETETLLTLCEDFEWFPREKTATLRSHLDEVSRILTTLRRQRRAAQPRGTPHSAAR
ncbi:MAG: four helix bundle protein [Chloroflexi bacterium]|nr:four helix bundle protein [Chloroflexota bacterium]